MTAQENSSAPMSSAPTPILCFVLTVIVMTIFFSFTATLQPVRDLAAPEIDRDPDEPVHEMGRNLNQKRRRRRAERAAATVEAVTSPPFTNLTHVPDATCHPAEHTGYAGDGAVVWGLGKPGFHLPDAASCCRACQQHNAICGQPGGRGKQWWPEKDMYGNARTDLHCGGDTSVACTIWTWCPVERCFAFDIHKHEFGECWLKFQKGDNPPYTRPKDPHEGHKVYPEIMRHAPRKIWPWSVKEEIWSGPMPKEVPWMSGVLAPADTQIVSSPPNDKWRERWCAKHGPCD